MSEDGKINEKLRVCAWCDGSLGIRRYGSVGQYCCAGCAAKASISQDKKARAIEAQQQKHEEIKQKAWELSKTALFRTIAVEGKNLKTPDQVMSWCLTIAESFYNLAKEKEKGND